MSRETVDQQRFQAEIWDARIFPANPAETEVRQLANLRQHLLRQRTMLINNIKWVINKHNLSHDAQTENSLVSYYHCRAV
jgi:transposase